MNAPEMAPAATNPVMDSVSDEDGERKRWDDFRSDCAWLYVKNNVAFSAIAPQSGVESPLR